MPHTDPDAGDDELKQIADLVASHGFTIGSLVAPVWPGTVGDAAMGDAEARQKFVTAVEKACRIAKVFNEHGVRKYGVIRIDSASGPSGLGEPTRRATPKSSPRRSAKRPRSPKPTTASGWPPKAKSAGPACTPGRTCSTCSKRSICRRRSASRPTWPTRTCICWATTPRSTRCSSRGLQRGGVLGRLQDDDRRAASLDDRFPHRPERRLGPRDRQPRQDRPALPGRRPERQARHRQVRQATGSRARPTAASSTSAGTAACSPTKCWRRRRRGTRYWT